MAASSPKMPAAPPKPSAKAMPDPPVGHMLEKLVIKGRVRPMRTNKPQKAQLADDLEAIQQMRADLEQAEHEATLEAMDLEEAPAAPAAEGGDDAPAGGDDAPAGGGARAWEVAINPPPPPDWQLMKQPKKWRPKKEDIWNDPTPWSWHMSSSSSSWDGWQWHRQDHRMQLGKMQRHADMSPFMVTQCIPVRSCPCPCSFHPVSVESHVHAHVHVLVSPICTTNTHDCMTLVADTSILYVHHNGPSLQAEVESRVWQPASFTTAAAACSTSATSTLSTSRGACCSSGAGGGG